MKDTVYALSSGHGRSGIAVVRVSGDDLQNLFLGICNKIPICTGSAQLSPDIPVRDTTALAAGVEEFGKGLANSKIKPRYAYFVDLVDRGGALIDKAIAIYFKGPNSFTGQDVIEFHVHGSNAVIKKLFETLNAHGARVARPGEFSRRAFQNNKMDLTEVDGLVSLLEARTDKQRSLALRSMTGGDSAIFETWRTQMISLAAHSAAILDYASDDLPVDIGERVLAGVQKLYGEIDNAILKSGAAQAIKSGFNIVLVGETNAGKSSLFNRLVGEARAIVSDIPGTTRDVVSAEMDIDGYLVRLSDTAGLRETADEIEKIGIERTRAEVENADLVLHVVGNAERAHILDNEILVFNKCDLIKSSAPGVLLVSAKTGDGIAELLDVIKHRIHEQLDGAEADIVVNERTRAHLVAARQELKNALNAETNYDIFAEHIHRAADELGQILGVIGVNEIADSVFGQLCLGK